MYAPNKSFKTHEAKTDIETERSIIIVRLQHSIIDRIENKDIENLNNSIN